MEDFTLPAQAFAGDSKDRIEATSDEFVVQLAAIGAIEQKDNGSNLQPPFESHAFQRSQNSNRFPPSSEQTHIYAPFYESGSSYEHNSTLPMHSLGSTADATVPGSFDFGHEVSKGNQVYNNSSNHVRQDNWNDDYDSEKRLGPAIFQNSQIYMNCNNHMAQNHGNIHDSQSHNLRFSISPSDCAQAMVPPYSPRLGEAHHSTYCGNLGPVVTAPRPTPYEFRHYTSPAHDLREPVFKSAEIVANDNPEASVMYAPALGQRCRVRKFSEFGDEITTPRVAQNPREYASYPRRPVLPTTPFSSSFPMPAKRESEWDRGLSANPIDLQFAEPDAKKRRLEGSGNPSNTINEFAENKNTGSGLDKDFSSRLEGDHLFQTKEHGRKKQSSKENMLRIEQIRDIMKEMGNHDLRNLISADQRLFSAAFCLLAPNFKKDHTDKEADEEKRRNGHSSIAVEKCSAKLQRKKQRNGEVLPDDLGEISEIENQEQRNVKREGVLGWMQLSDHQKSVPAPYPTNPELASHLGPRPQVIPTTSKFHQHPAAPEMPKPFDNNSEVSLNKKYGKNRRKSKKPNPKLDDPGEPMQYDCQALSDTKKVDGAREYLNQMTNNQMRQLLRSHQRLRSAANEVNKETIKGTVVEKLFLDIGENDLEYRRLMAKYPGLGDFVRRLHQEQVDKINRSQVTSTERTEGLRKERGDKGDGGIECVGKEGGGSEKEKDEWKDGKPKMDEKHVGGEKEDKGVKIKGRDMVMEEEKIGLDSGIGR